MLEYALVFALLASIGFGLPLPEETVLLLAAYFLSTGSSAGYLVLIAVLSIAFSDTVRYIRGRYQSVAFAKFKRGKQFIASTGFFAMFVSRFFITARMVVPFMCGAMRMPRLPFHMASVLSALVSSLVLIVGGSWVYRSLALVTTGATVLWFSFVAVVTGALMMWATRSQMKLLRR